MKLYLILSLMFLVPTYIVGQTTIPNEYCGGLEDYSDCKKYLECNANSRCSCKNETHYCRCNNYDNWWFMGKDCQQKWSILTFALVASLPGLALAAIVGVTVQLVHYYSKPAKAPKNPNGPLQMTQNVNAAGQNGAYSNLVFAADLPGRPMDSKVQPPQEGFPMTNPLSRPYSNQPNGVQPSFDRPTLPPPATQPYNPQPNIMRPSIDRKTVANPGSQPYNYATGMTQPLGNNYSRGPSFKNPYEERAPPVDHYDDYRPSHPPSRQSSMMGGVVPSFPAPNSQAPFYSAPEYNPRSQIPRAQMGRPM